MTTTHKVYEVRFDRHGNACEILCRSFSGNFDHAEVYQVRYKGEKRLWTTRSGKNYFTTLAAARRKVDSN